MESRSGDDAVEQSLNRGDQAAARGHHDLHRNVITTVSFDGGALLEGVGNDAVGTHGDFLDIEITRARMRFLIAEGAQGGGNTLPDHVVREWQ